MFFFRKIHRDEFFKRQPLNKPVYRYRYLENPLYSIYEDYRWLSIFIQNFFNYEIQKIYIHSYNDQWSLTIVQK